MAIKATTLVKAPKKPTKKGGKVKTKPLPSIELPGSEPTPAKIPDSTMRIVLQPTNKLVYNIKNARKHSEENIDKIVASIRTFGFINPVVTDGEFLVIAGGGRLMAAKRLGLEVVPTIETSHLTPLERQAYALADNRIAEDSDWDGPMLKINLQELAGNFDMTVLGWTDDALKDLLADTPEEGEYPKGQHVPPTRITIKCQAGDHSDIKNLIETTLRETGFEKVEVL